MALAVFGVDIDLVGGNAQNESSTGLNDVRSRGKRRLMLKANVPLGFKRVTKFWVVLLAPLQTLVKHLLCVYNYNNQWNDPKKYIVCSTQASDFHFN